MKYMLGLIMCAVASCLCCVEQEVNGYNGSRYRLIDGKVIKDGNEYITQELRYNNNPIVLVSIIDQSAAVRFGTDGDLSVSTAQSIDSELIIISMANGGISLILRRTASLNYVIVPQNEISQFGKLIFNHFVKFALE
jgi:hypothetical protein